jgi:hypothetical protein
MTLAQDDSVAEHAAKNSAQLALAPTDGALGLCPSRQRETSDDNDFHTRFIHFALPFRTPPRDDHCRSVIRVICPHPMHWTPLLSTPAWLRSLTTRHMCSQPPVSDGASWTTHHCSGSPEPVLLGRSDKDNDLLSDGLGPIQRVGRFDSKHNLSRACRLGPGGVRSVSPEARPPAPREGWGRGPGCAKRPSRF